MPSVITANAPGRPAALCRPGTAGRPRNLRSPVPRPCRQRGRVEGARLAGGQLAVTAVAERNVPLGRQVGSRRDPLPPGGDPCPEVTCVAGAEVTSRFSVRRAGSPHAPASAWVLKKKKKNYYSFLFSPLRTEVAHNKRNVSGVEGPAGRQRIVQGLWRDTSLLPGGGERPGRASLQPFPGWGRAAGRAPARPELRPGGPSPPWAAPCKQEAPPTPYPQCPF